MRLSAVVFDVGGVLLEWEPRRLYETLIPDAAARDRFLAEVCTPEWNATLDAGRDLDEACAELSARHPDHADLIGAWKRQGEMCSGPIPGMPELVEELDVPRYLLTNAPRWVFDDRCADYPFLGRFDGAVVSGDEGILKPDRRIFDLLASRFGLDPTATLFVDDSVANVDGARRAGLVAHRFTDAVDLRRQLVNRGVLSSS